MGTNGNSATRAKSASLCEEELAQRVADHLATKGDQLVDHVAAQIVGRYGATMSSEEAVASILGAHRALLDGNVDPRRLPPLGSESPGAGDEQSGIERLGRGVLVVVGAVWLGLASLGLYRHVTSPTPAGVVATQLLLLGLLATGGAGLLLFSTVPLGLWLDTIRRGRLRDRIDREIDQQRRVTQRQRKIANSIQEAEEQAKKIKARVDDALSKVAGLESYVGLVTDAARAEAQARGRRCPLQGERNGGPTSTGDGGGSDPRPPASSGTGTKP